MSHIIQAVFEHGVFRPLEPVELAEHEQVSLVVTAQNFADGIPRDAAGDAIIRRQRESLAKLGAEMDALPARAPQDGLGGADHDQILYGWQK